METRITRSWPHTLLLGGFGLALAIWAIFLFREDSTGWGLFVGAAGAFCLAGSALLGGKAPCPDCGGTLAYLSPMMKTPYNKCPDCGAYFRGEAGLVRAIEPDHAADVPQFSITLPEKFVLPGLCCACGAPADRAETVSLGIRLVHGPASLTAQAATLSLEVPHCGKHQGGAKLDRELPEGKLDFETLFVSGRKDPVTVLKVKSYAFYRAFLASNA
ncbi:MAG: hypothetical protein HZB91_12700 [Elusimicrobia bacterium]|nr:hypothetical protein [Elusimicrobiota bacterium]